MRKKGLWNRCGIAVADADAVRRIRLDGERSGRRAGIDGQRARIRDG